MNKNTGGETSHSARKTLVLHDPDPPSRLGFTILFVLLCVSVWFLGALYNLPNSSFPHDEAEYYETYDTYWDRDGQNGMPSGEWEWSLGGSLAPLYRGLIPAVLLVWFSFQVGRGCVVGKGRDVSWVLGLGCVCLIGYCGGWLIEDRSTLWAVARIAAFAVAGTSLVCSWLVTIIMPYTKCSYRDPTALLLMSRYTNAGSSRRDESC